MGENQVGREQGVRDHNGLYPQGCRKGKRRAGLEGAGCLPDLHAVDEVGVERGRSRVVLVLIASLLQRHQLLGQLLGAEQTWHLAWGGDVRGGRGGREVRHSSDTMRAFCPTSS